MVAGTPAAEWPLTEGGRTDARGLGERLASRVPDPTVWASPERRARETAELAFPRVRAVVRAQLAEVKKPWYASADEHADAVAGYLTGARIGGWEHRREVVTRLAHLPDLASARCPVLVSHGVLLTTWLVHQIGLDDPLSFWTELRMPDAWECDVDARSLLRVA